MKCDARRVLHEAGSAGKMKSNASDGPCRKILVPTVPVENDTALGQFEFPSWRRFADGQFAKKTFAYFCAEGVFHIVEKTNIHDRLVDFLFRVAIQIRITEFVFQFFPKMLFAFSLFVPGGIVKVLDFDEKPTINAFDENIDRFQGRCAVAGRFRDIRFIEDEGIEYVMEFKDETAGFDSYHCSPSNVRVISLSMKLPKVSSIELGEIFAYSFVEAQAIRLVSGS